jgi:hypothetical protein
MRKTIVALLLAAGLVLSAWAGEHRMKNSSTLVPSATGKVDVDKDKNGNHVLKVRVYHLVDPEKLTPPRNGYVVWMQPKGKDPENLGMLKVNKDLEGSLEATTPYKNFTVFVTAEENPKPDSPSGDEILRGEIE